MHVYEFVVTFEYLQVIHSNFILANLKALGNSNKKNILTLSYFCVVPALNQWGLIQLADPSDTADKVQGNYRPPIMVFYSKVTTNLC